MKNLVRKNKFLVIPLLFSLQAIAASSVSASDQSAENIRVESKQFGDYRVTIFKSFDSYEGELLITKNSVQVFKEREFDVYYYFGNWIDGTDVETDPYSGKDITGNQEPDLVITKRTGGAHCCQFLYVFEIGKSFRHLLTVDAQSSDIYLKDLDGDKVPEIEFWDGSIDYRFASFASSSKGHFILKYNGKEYQPAVHLMRKPAPNKNEIKRIKSQIQKIFDPQYPEVPYELLEPMMNLSYCGHLDLALKLADETWPPKRPGIEKFKNDFRDALRESRYWKSLSEALAKAN
ncbi:MAG: hypothetical protein COV44_11900 [Deltaproteobacteria bacterium CG11_big_fil_rev_8_21_14_0_20_45_16]|nr:MAG: hypothetical protein COV44_11900 [Deltaproteobacteria bacterium CG11_big_fil_rev_8_21_14_0_20_45_16]